MIFDDSLDMEIFGDIWWFWGILQYVMNWWFTRYGDIWWHMMILGYFTICHEMSLNVTMLNWNVFGVSWHVVIFGNIWWHLMIFHDKTRLFIMICHDISWIVMTCPQPIQRGRAYNYRGIAMSILVSIWSFAIKHECQVKLCMEYILNILFRSLRHQHCKNDFIPRGRL